MLASRGGQGRICSEYQKLIRLKAMRRSPSLATRIKGHVLTLLADHDVEAGD